MLRISLQSARTSVCSLVSKAKREKQLRISLNGTNIQGQFSVSSLKDKVEIFNVRSEEWVITNAF